MKAKHDLTLKILTIGESGVGKTCILLRYTDNKFIKNHLTTIGIDYKSKLVQLNGKTIKVKIWDTAGQERFQNITQQYYKGADGIVLVYDITDRNSYEKITDWMRQIQANTKSEEIAVVLLGNKSDLEENRQVSTQEGEKKAEEHKVKFFETSADKGTNVEESFEYLSKSIINRKGLLGDDFNVNEKRMVIISEESKVNGSQKKKKCC